MAWSSAMMDEAKRFVTNLPTDTAATFKSALAAEGLKALGGSGEGIEWWNCPPLERPKLTALVKAGARRDHCKALLADFLRGIPKTTQSSDLVNVTAEFDRSGWLKYYLYEAMACSDKKPAEATMVLDILGALYFKGQDSVVFGEGPGFNLRQPLDSIDDELFCGLLYELMTIGFARIPATLEDAIAGSASNAAIIGRMLWAGDAAAVQGTPIKVVKVKAKWRGDSRPPADIKSASGFITKVQSDGYAKFANLNAAWHPLSKEYGKRWLWYRKANTDNCLYTAISVGKAGKDHLAYTVYPLIKLSGGKVTGLRGYKGTREVLCQPVAGGPPVKLSLPVSVTYLYYFVFAGLALDTGAMQGQGAYPEVGAPSIPYNNVVGAVQVTRYHLGPEDTVSDEEGVLCVYTEAARNDDNLLTARASYGEELYTKMCSRFDAVAKRATPDAAKWAATGHTDMNGLNATFSYGGKSYRVAVAPPPWTGG